MQTLDAYLAAPGSKSLTVVAIAIGVSKGRLSQLRDSREWPPALALAVERETGIDASGICPVIAAARQGLAV